MSRCALISTIYSPVGGVTTMIRAVADLLRARGWEVRLGFYVPWSQAPELSVRFPGLGAEGPDWRTRFWEGEPELLAYEIGARFPEFEWQRYRVNEGWRQAIADHDVHLVVSGNILPAAPIVEEGRPCLAWVATRYWPDKRDRLRSFGWPRRLFDLAVNTPVALALERRLARTTRLHALSRHTAEAFRAAVPESTPTVLPMGVDTDRFWTEGHVGREKVGRRKIGFVGRLEDPRKNVALLLNALGELTEMDVDVELHLVGGELSSRQKRRLAEAGLAGRVRVTGHMEHPELADYYRSLDAFLIPSHQEGLAIVGLEAMACGCPVVTTRCGGPEEYVEDGLNGFVVDFDARAMAAATRQILLDEGRRQQMSEQAAATVRSGYSRKHMQETFWSAFDATYGSKVA